MDQLLLETEPQPSTSTFKNEVKVPKIDNKKAEKLKIEKVEKEYMDVIDEERLDDEDNIFEQEIYDILEIDNEENEEKIYLDEGTSKQVLGEEDGEFILVNFKSSSEDLTDTQFIVEEVNNPRARRKAAHRIPKEVVEKYAQSTRTNQHICTKCVKVFSTRTNLIRHIQSHDGYKVSQFLYKYHSLTNNLIILAIPM